jgi:hypothetical protein
MAPNSARWPPPAHLEHVLRRIRSPTPRAEWTCFEERFLNPHTRSDIAAELEISFEAVHASRITPLLRQQFAGDLHRLWSLRRFRQLLRPPERARLVGSSLALAIAAARSQILCRWLSVAAPYKNMGEIQRVRIHQREPLHATSHTSRQVGPVNLVSARRFPSDREMCESRAEPDVHNGTSFTELGSVNNNNF